jgi:hypothetical protein
MKLKLLTLPLCTGEAILAMLLLKNRDKKNNKKMRMIIFGKVG